jgi:hypothetical protein
VPDELDVLLGRVRQLTTADMHMAGGTESFRAFRDLVQLLLQITVLDDGQHVRLARHAQQRGTAGSQRRMKKASARCFGSTTYPNRETPRIRRPTSMC